MKGYIRIDNALVHPDHIQQYHEGKIRRAYSSLDSCILGVAQQLSLLLNDRMVADARPVTQRDIDACFDTVHDAAYDDVLRYGHSESSIGSALWMPEVASVLAPEVLDNYRANYRAKVLTMLCRILPIYHRTKPGNDDDVIQSVAMVDSLLWRPTDYYVNQREEEPETVEV